MKTNTTAVPPPTADAAYNRYALLLTQYHRLLTMGQEEDRETTDIEEEMTSLWDRLDALQRQSLAGLASDLAWIRRGGTPAPRAPQADDISSEDREALNRENADWHRALHLARVCAAAVPARQLARLRATAWENLGLPDVAALFRQFQARLDDAAVAK